MPRFPIALAALPMLAAPMLAAPATAEPLEIVASFSILADMTRTVGGDRVNVTALVGPDGDAHVFSPTPRNAANVAQADLMIVNGLGFEGWLDRLVEASGFEGTVVTASAVVDPLPAQRGEDHHAGADHEDEHEAHADADHDDHASENHADDDHDDHDHADHAEEHDGHVEAGHADHHHHGAYDPHAWHDLTNAALYVETIAAALSEADPEGAATYTANAAAYTAELAALDASARKVFSAIPKDRRTVLTSHDAFAYLGRAYGLEFVAPQGMSTETEASARDVAELVRQIRAEGVDAIFIESVTDNRMVERIAEETGIAIGGELYAGALSQADGDASTYVAMMRHNIDALAEALGASEGAVR